MATSAFNISLVIGAALSGTFSSAISGARAGLDKIGKGTDELTRLQRRMGDVMSQALAHPLRNVGVLRERYDRLGASIKTATREQERMAAAMNRMAELKQQRGELRGDLMDKTATGYAVGAPLMKSIRIAASFEDQIKDVAITGNLGKMEESKLGKALRENALRVNQTQDEMARGVSILVANGMNVQAAQQYSGLLGKTATATRGSMQDLSQLMFALNTSFKVEGEKGMKEALDALAHAGKQGQFELKEMARYFPELGASMASFGATGLDAVKELGMAMQVARKYSGTNEEAATNAKNWFAKMTAGVTVENFAKVGIDYKGDMMKRMREQKISALQASLQTTDAYIDKVAAGKTIEVRKGKKVEKLSFRDALDAAKASGNEAEVTSVVERFGLSKVFQDMQTVNFYMAMRQGKDMFKSGMATFDTAEAKNVVDRDYAKRMESATEQFKSFKIAAIELGINIGGLLLPTLTSMITVIKPVVDTVGRLASAFPNVTKGAIGLTVGLIGGGIAIAGISFATNMAATSLAAIRVGIHGTRAALALLRGAMIAGNFSAITAALASTRFAPFITGIRSAALAMRAFNLTMLANPVGLAIAGIAVGALLIIAYWKPIKAFFGGLWSGFKEGLAPLKEVFKSASAAAKPLKEMFAPVIGFIKQLLTPLNFTNKTLSTTALIGKGIGYILALAFTSPIYAITGIIKAITTVWATLRMLRAAFSLLGLVGLKMAFHALTKQFFDGGANIAKSIGSGIMSAINAPVEAIKSVVKKVRNFLPFSPAKEGPLKDINRIRLVETIAEGMKPAPMVQAMKGATAAAMLAATVAVSPVPGLAQPAAGQAQRPAVSALARPAAAQGQGGGMHITFSPQITIQGGGDPAQISGQVNEAMRMSFAEFERLMKQYERQQQRRSF